MNKTQIKEGEKKEREHIHRCPICERFKKTVRINAKIIREQFKVFFDVTGYGKSMVLTRQNIDDIWENIEWPLFYITHDLDVTSFREIKKMSDKEFKNFLLKDRKTPAPFIPCVTSEDGTPKFYLIKGGINHEQSKTT